MHQDIKRFLYAKQKMNTLQISSSDYDPYPGYFLSQTEGKVLLTEILYAINTKTSNFISTTTREEFIDLLRQMDSVFEENLTFAKENATAYLTFQKLWEKFMQKLTFNFSLAYLHQ